MHELTKILKDAWTENSSRWEETSNRVIVDYMLKKKAKLYDAATSFYPGQIEAILGLDDICDKCGR